MALNISLGQDANLSIQSLASEDVAFGVFKLIELVINCVLLQISALVGLWCSLVSLIVLSQFKVVSKSASILLLSLSVADFLFCLTISISRFSCILFRVLNVKTASTIDVNIFLMLSITSRLFYVNSITLGGVIALERFLVVFFPFRSPSIITPLKIKIAVVSVYILNFALLEPVMFCFRKEVYYDVTEDSFVEIVVPTDFYINNYDALNIEVSLVHNNVFIGSSLIITLLLTPAIAVKLRMVVSERSKLTQRRFSFDPTVAKMLVTVCAVNILFYGPLVTFESACHIMPHFSLISNISRAFRTKYKLLLERLKTKKTFQPIIVLSKLCG
ncbi:somatostatin receptor type 5 [Biomphalaria glabrata]|nr:somatostatin receptor type 5 [Biomphalaria glabrata]